MAGVCQEGETFLFFFLPGLSQKEVGAGPGHFEFGDGWEQNKRDPGRRDRKKGGWRGLVRVVYSTLYSVRATLSVPDRIRRPSPMGEEAGPVIVRLTVHDPRQRHHLRHQHHLHLN